MLYQPSLKLLRELNFDDKTWSRLHSNTYGAISRNWIDAEKNCLHKADMKLLDNKMKFDFMTDKDEEYADVIGNEKKDDELG